MISVNVLVWNNKSTIVKTLTAIENDLKDTSHEYIIVDNGSTDGSCDLVSGWIADSLPANSNFVCHQENLGISVGKNRGIGLSKGEYIFMCDGDVVPVPNSIRMMIAWMDSNIDKVAIGMHPNKFVTSPDMAGGVCEKLADVKEHRCACLYYGLYRRRIFDGGLRMSEDGEFGKPGYGWEDHDFFERFKKAGHTQYVADINNHTGRYYHHINSSIRAMGREVYMETSRARGKQFHEAWDAA